METATILFSFIFNQFIIYLLLKKQPIGSDHYYHINLIKHIRDNRHRFITTYKNTSYNNELAYPQFYHWMLSFLSPTLVDRHYKWFIFTFSGLSYFGFVLFLLMIQPYYPDHDLMLWCPLIYVFTPFHYDIRNAKNIGLSVRGLGLMLGHFYLYSTLLYLIKGNVFFLFLAVVIVLIILMANKFSFQFVAFSAPLLALFYGDIFILLVPFIALTIFFIILPKQARQNLKGQMGHKKLYYKYLAEKFILHDRYSIWRDLVWDIPLKIKQNVMSGLEYAYGNSVITLLRGFPFLVLLSGYYVVSLLSGRQAWTPEAGLMAIPVLVALLLFVGTSFRKTRFLGEPERYIEFSIGILSILAVFTFSGRTIALVLGISTLLIFFEMFLPKFRKKRLAAYGRPTDSLEFLVPEIRKLKAELGEVVLLSNAYQVLKRFYSEEVEVCFGELSSEWLGEFHFTTVFPEDLRYINPEIILPLIKMYQVNVLIIDTGALPDVSGILTGENLEWRLVAEKDHLKVYVVSQADG